MLYQLGLEGQLSRRAPASLLSMPSALGSNPSTERKRLLDQVPQRPRNPTQKLEVSNLWPVDAFCLSCTEPEYNVLPIFLTFYFEINLHLEKMYKNKIIKFQCFLPSMSSRLTPYITTVQLQKPEETFFLFYSPLDQSF